MTTAVQPPSSPEASTGRVAASFARRLCNSLAAHGGPAGAELWDDALVDAVDAARTHGTPLASIVTALQAEAAERGWA
jgi:hypothetical protein